jgi:hypothetical protein
MSESESNGAGYPSSWLMRRVCQWAVQLQVVAVEPAGDMRRVGPDSEGGSCNAAPAAGATSSAES